MLACQKRPRERGFDAEMSSPMEPSCSPKRMLVFESPTSKRTRMMGQAARDSRTPAGSFRFTPAFLYLSIYLSIPNLRAESTLTTTPSTRSTPKPPLSTAGRRGRRAGARRFCCRRSLGAYALGVLLFLPASILVLLTAEFGFDTRTWYTRLRRPGSREDEPRRDSYVASELREAVKELQAAKEQLGSTVALAAAPAHGSSLGAIAASSTVAAPVRTIGSAPSGQPEAAQPEAAAATRSAARSRSGGKPSHKLGVGRSGGISEGGRSAISEDLIRAALDDVGLEGILGELSESTHLRRESSEGKELLRQQRASAALRQHEQLSEEEVLPHDQSAPLAAPQLGSCASSGRAWRPRAARHSQGEAERTGRQATAFGARTSRLQSRQFHRL